MGELRRSRSLGRSVQLLSTLLHRLVQQWGWPWAALHVLGFSQVWRPSGACPCDLPVPTRLCLPL